MSHYISVIFLLVINRNLDEKTKLKSNPKLRGNIVEFQNSKA